MVRLRFAATKPTLVCAFASVEPNALRIEQIAKPGSNVETRQHFDFMSAVLPRQQRMTSVDVPTSPHRIPDWRVSYQLDQSQRFNTLIRTDAFTYFFLLRVACSTAKRLIYECSTKQIMVTENVNRAIHDASKTHIDFDTCQN